LPHARSGGNLVVEIGQDKGTSMASTEYRPRVVIFAGAGASRALQDSQFPTTVEFFEALPPSITTDAHFSFFESFVRSSKNDDTIDIEEILLELQRLLSFLQAANDNQSIIGRAVANNLLARVQNGWGFGQLHGGGTRLAEQLGQLQGRINAQVYQLYSKEPTDSELDQTWNPLLSHLIDKSHLDIFTTNYDLVVENSIQSVRSEKTMYEYLGAIGRAQKSLDLKQWREDSGRSVGLLTKLHGSLNWKFSGEQIVLGDWVFTGDHAKQAIIYPGFKGESQALFFDPFHEYLSRTLARADHVLIIGFAFRDDAINQIFRTSLSADANITIMDPNKSLTLPTRRKVNRVGGFDASSVAAFLKALNETPAPSQRRRIRAI
jgi:hypothetical protein